MDDLGERRGERLRALELIALRRWVIDLEDARPAQCFEPIGARIKACS